MRSSLSLSSLIYFIPSSSLFTNYSLNSCSDIKGRVVYIETDRIFARHGVIFRALHIRFWGEDWVVWTMDLYFSPKIASLCWLTLNSITWSKQKLASNKLCFFIFQHFFFVVVTVPCHSYSLSVGHELLLLQAIQPVEVVS